MRKQKRKDLFTGVGALPSLRANIRGGGGGVKETPPPPESLLAGKRSSATTRCFLAAHKSFLCSTQSERMHMDQSKLLVRVQINVVSLALRTQWWTRPVLAPVWPRSSVGSRATDDQIRRASVQFPPRSEIFFFVSFVLPFPY